MLFQLQKGVCVFTVLPACLSFPGSGYQISKQIPGGGGGGRATKITQTRFLLQCFSPSTTLSDGSRPSPLSPALMAWIVEKEIASVKVDQ